MVLFAYHCSLNMPSTPYTGRIQWEMDIVQSYGMEYAGKVFGYSYYSRRITARLSEI